MVYQNVSAPKECAVSPKTLPCLVWCWNTEDQGAGLGREGGVFMPCSATKQFPVWIRAELQGKSFHLKDVKSCPYFTDLLIFISDMWFFQWLRGTWETVGPAWDFIQGRKKEQIQRGGLEWPSEKGHSCFTIKILYIWQGDFTPIMQTYLLQITKKHYNENVIIHQDGSLDGDLQTTAFRNRI